MRSTPKIDRVIFTPLICEEYWHNKKANIRLSAIMVVPASRKLWKRDWLVVAFSLQEMYYRDLCGNYVQKRAA
jgi:hypothetical protein